MTYASRHDLEQRYTADEVSQRESALPPGGVDLALTDADDFINGYLSTGYSLPLAPVPPNLVKVASAIARYYLLGDAATEQAREDYNDAVSWLKDVAAGRVKLQEAAPVPGNEPATTVLLASSPSVFGRMGRP